MKRLLLLLVLPALAFGQSAVRFNNTTKTVVDPASGLVLTAPVLGTPASVTLTNGTGLPIGGITGLGTGVGTALANNLNAASGLIGFSGSLGSPSGLSIGLSGSATTLGTPILNINGDWKTSSAGSIAQLLVNQSGGSLTTLSTAGTGFAINASSTTADFVNFLAADSTKFRILGTGAVVGTTSGAVGTLTLGDVSTHSSFVLASNLSGATDPTITFGNAVIATSSAFNIGGTTNAFPQLTPFTNWASAAGLALIEGDATTGNVSLHTTIYTGGSAVNDASGVSYLVNTASSRLLVASGWTIGWSSGTGAAGATFNTSGDTSLSRIAPGVVAVGTGAAGSFAGSLKATNAEFVGTLSVTGASVLTGNLTSNGALISVPQALSGEGAVNLTTLSTAFTATGTANALSLADAVNGQIKIVTMVGDGGTGTNTGVLTPTTTKTGFTSVALNNPGDSVTLQFYTTAGWIITSANGAVITP
jgi:hypothetical protein